MRTVPGACDGSQGGAKPFLTFTCRGPNLNMVQDLPISKPHSPAQVDELLATNAQGGDDATGMMCPLYLDLLPVAPRLLVCRSRSTLACAGHARVVRVLAGACRPSRVAL